MGSKRRGYRDGDIAGSLEKSGEVFDMYTFDAVSNGLINVATGEMDLVNRTMKFKIAPLK